MALAIWEMVDHSPLTTSCFDSSAFSYCVCLRVSACVCVHIVPLGQTAWRMELCHFGDCFPGIVFLDMPVVLLEHYKSIKRSFLRFFFFFPSQRHLLQDTSARWSETLPISAENENKGVSLCSYQFLSRCLVWLEEHLIMVHSSSLWLL